jgi:hypothetical protein
VVLVGGRAGGQAELVGAEGTALGEDSLGPPLHEVEVGPGHLPHR